MSQPVRFRSLYWIGWLIWAVVGTWLLVRLPESLPFVTWTHGEGVIHVTWSLIVSWMVLFWAWPVVFRTTGVKDCMVRAGRGIAAGPSMLRAGMRRSPLFFVSWLVLMVAWQVASYVVPAGTLEHPLVPGWDYVFGDAFFGMSRYWAVSELNLGFATFNLEGLAPLPTHGGEATWLAVFLAIAYHSGVSLFRLLSGLVIGITLGRRRGPVPAWSCRSISHRARPPLWRCPGPRKAGHPCAGSNTAYSPPIAS